MIAPDAQSCSRNMVRDGRKLSLQSLNVIASAVNEHNSHYQTVRLPADSVPLTPGFAVR